MSEYLVKNKYILSFWKDNVIGTIEEQKEAIILYLLRNFGLEVTDEIKSLLHRKLSSCYFNNYKKKFNLLPKNKRNFFNTSNQKKKLRRKVIIYFIVKKHY